MYEVNSCVCPTGSWMNIPYGPVNCPSGLEYLTLIDQLLVHQEVELLEGKQFKKDTANFSFASQKQIE